MKEKSVALARLWEQAEILGLNWLKLYFYGVLAACIVVVLEYTFSDKVKNLMQAPWQVAAATAIGIFALIAANTKGRAKAFFGIRHFTAKPPYWIGSVIATQLLCLFFSAYTRELFSTVCVESVPRALSLAALVLAIFLFLAFIASLVSLFTNPQTNASTACEHNQEMKQEDRATEILSDKEFEDWIKSSDDPIESPEKDLFGYRFMAKRIAKRIIENPRKMPSQAIIGNLGSGKTTTGLFVGKELAPYRNIHFVQISLWQYKTPEAAVKGVIDSVIKELSKEIPVFHLSGTTEDYIRAISAAGGIWGFIDGIFNRSKESPWEIIRHISNELAMIDVRLVLWIEDLERFAGTHGGYALGAELDHERERLNPIRSLLYALNEEKSICVILATTSLNERFDLEKIARYVEQLPTLPDEYIGKYLEWFRDSRLKKETYINPLLTQNDANYSLSDIGDLAKNWATRAHIEAQEGGENICYAIYSLCATPRIFKQGLRRVNEFWEKFTGEIDFDDLLVMCLVRESEPDLFAFIHKNFNGLRFSIDPNDDVRQSVDRALVEALDEERGTLKLKYLSKSMVDSIIRYIFDTRPRYKVQGIARHTHTDYWKRFLSEDGGPVEYLDQSILQLMYDDNISGAIKVLLDGNKIPAFNDFCTNLSPKKLKHLLIPLVQSLKNEDPRTWRERDPASLDALNKAWKNVVIHSEDTVEPEAKNIVKEALKIAVSDNLVLACSVRLLFVDLLLMLAQIKSSKESAHRSLVEELGELLLMKCSKDEESFAKQLTNAHPWILLQACFGLLRNQETPVSTIPFKAWPELSRIIIRLGEKYPNEMLPQICGLVCLGNSTISDIRHHPYVFSDQIATLLFGNLKNIERLFRDVEPSHWPDDRTQALITAVKAGVTQPD